ncbi:hypothetical protein OEB99_19160 [Actinotalea sp. M2MS4P-6]|uniref:hypothetical protein n=1 Tax=Actinotalea sp. M2MS4P-6 TaxID=2983762 RepID=UPI0021E36398|nr:hypothetical protein [Actinotalea sp. M2MS4P-6]MCV2396436.1 hypothetical protein [Actinotalea sp. M2MS4P-6]
MVMQVALELALVAVLVLGCAVALMRVVAQDGRGHRLPPRSHRRWDEGTTVAGPR